MAREKALKGHSKGTKGYSKGTKRVVEREKGSTDNLCSVWVFTNVDREGKFAFDVSRGDFRHKDVMEKLIEYSRMTWRAIKNHTHDKGKSKHHYLSYKSLSKDAQDRFMAKKLEKDSDALFSFALNNTLRIVGIREGEKFKVLWYDPKHEVCPSAKKHT